MPELLTNWTGSLHQTFRLLPKTDQSRNLRPFLTADGASPQEILERLPYDVPRAVARGGSATSPDPKRYRDGKQIYQTVGLLYEGEDGKVHVTELGTATARWLDIITEKNSVVLGRHVAYALAACQLRNPTGAGSRYDPSMTVFPFQFIWRAMIDLDNKISSAEINRAVFKIRNEDDLSRAVHAIREARRAGNVGSLGEEVVTGDARNDRIIPWMSLASFGWTLFPDKRSADDSEYYEIPPRTMAVIKEASRIRHRHRDFVATEDYVKYVSDCAALPKDIR